MSKAIHTPIVSGKALKVAAAKTVAPKLPHATIRSFGGGYSAIVNDAQGHSSSVYADDIPSMVSKVEGILGQCTIDVDGTSYVAPVAPVHTITDVEAAYVGEVLNGPAV